MKSKSLYRWAANEPLPEISVHSTAKHEVYRNYLRDYLRERTKKTGMDRYKINVVDGFAGGGVYSFGPNATPYHGSPIILLRTLQEMQVELQARQNKPFLLDYTVHLVEPDEGASNCLKSVLRQEGFGSLIGESVFVHNSHFEDALPNLLPYLDRRGRTIFILDQYGYKQVPFNILNTIFATLKKPEVILTFMYDHLASFVQQYDPLNQALADMNAGQIERGEYEAAIRQTGGLEFLIQRTLRRAFLNIADYYTPFFITSRNSNLAFWLVHLSTHARARDVMTGLHWSLHNHFAHFGRPGQNMLGFDPAHMMDHRQPFLFDDDARSRTKSALMEELPREIYNHGNGRPVSFAQLFSAICNDSPASSAIHREVLAKLAREKEITISTGTGGSKRSFNRINPEDLIEIQRQAKFKF